MKKLKTFTLKRPLFFSILLMVFALIVFNMPTEKLFLPFYDLQYSTFLKELTNKVLVSIIIILLLVKLDFIKSIGLNTLATRGKDWLIAWPSAIILLIGLLPLIVGSLAIDLSKANVITIFILMNLFIGLSEELLVRGVILSVLLTKWGNTKKRIYYSVIVSSVIFGAAHLGNIIGNTGSLVATLSQVVYATLIGIFFAACVLRSQSIWPAIIIHAAIDFVSQLQQIAVGGGVEVAAQATSSMTLMQAFQPVVIYAMLAGYGFFILKKVTPTTVKSRFDNYISENGVN